MPSALALPSSERLDALRQRGLSLFPLSLRAASINDVDRSFEAVVATEVRATVIDWQRYEIIDEILVARGGQFPEHMPLLPNHRRYDVLDVIGSAREFRLTNSQWIGRGFVAAPANDDDEVNVIWKRVADGHIRAVSIGYQVMNSVDIPAGSKQEVNGRTYQAEARPLRISKEWRAHELSLTPIGADEFALIRSFQGSSAPINRSYFR